MADKSTKERAAEAAEKGAKNLWIAITWGVPILLIVGAVWFLTRPGERVGAGADASPREVYDAYTTFVRPYRPPSSQFPSPGTVDDWLRYFDSGSRDWFRDNVDKLSFVAMRRNATEWSAANHQRRRQEAMQYLLTQGPIGGGAASDERVSDDGDSSVVSVTLISGSTSSVPMTSSRTGWVFRDMMGMQPSLAQQMAGVQLPE